MFDSPTGLSRHVSEKADLRLCFSSARPHRRQPEARRARRLCRLCYARPSGRQPRSIYAVNSILRGGGGGVGREPDNCGGDVSLVFQGFLGVSVQLYPYILVCRGLCRGNFYKILSDFLSDMFDTAYRDMVDRIDGGPVLSHFSNVAQYSFFDVKIRYDYLPLPYS